MDQAYAAHYQSEEMHRGMLVVEYDDDYEAFEYHRDRLIELRAVAKLQYDFQCVKQNTEECEHLQHFLMDTKNCPPLIEWVGEAGRPNQSIPFSITVWCLTKDKASWEELLASRDVVQYRSVFMDSQIQK